MAAKQRTTTTPKSETPATSTLSDLEAILSSLGLEIAKAKLGAELEQHVSKWIFQILLSTDSEAQAVRQELISNVSRLLAAKTLQQCLSGAIADSTKALESASETERFLTERAEGEAA